jgi:hypothetical protein
VILEIAENFRDGGSIFCPKKIKIDGLVNNTPSLRVFLPINLGAHLRSSLVAGEKWLCRVKKYKIVKVKKNFPRVIIKVQVIKKHQGAEVITERLKIDMDRGAQLIKTVRNNLKDGKQKVTFEFIDPITKIARSCGLSLLINNKLE